MKQGHEYAIPESLQGATADLVVKKLCQISWNTARTWISQGRCLLDGTTIRRDRMIIRGVFLQVLPESPLRHSAFEQWPAGFVVAEDPDFILVNKPAGLLSAPFPGEEEPSALSWLQQADRRYRQRQKPHQKIYRVVHRLDCQTSGLLIFATSTIGARALGQQFREHTLRRIYWALVHGRPKNQTVTSHLLDDRGDGRRGSWESLPAERRGKRPRGLPATTHLQVLESFSGASLVACELETGRTHQIRIHLSELGHPLLGDAVYGKDSPAVVQAAGRVMLHSREMGFRHPRTGDDVSWVVDPPQDFLRVLTGLRPALETFPRKATY